LDKIYSKSSATVISVMAALQAIEKSSQTLPAAPRGRAAVRADRPHSGVSAPHAKGRRHPTSVPVSTIRSRRRGRPGCEDVGCVSEQAFFTKFMIASYCFWRWADHGHHLGHHVERQVAVSNQSPDTSPQTRCRGPGPRPPRRRSAAGRLGYAPGFRPRHGALHAVEVDRVMVHSDVDGADTYALADSQPFCHALSLPSAPRSRAKRIRSQRGGARAMVA
jgi:hypothetical protein